MVNGNMRLLSNSLTLTISARVATLNFPVVVGWCIFGLAVPINLLLGSLCLFQRAE